MWRLPGSTARSTCSGVSTLDVAISMSSLGRVYHLSRSAIDAGSPAKLKSNFESMLDGLSQVDHKAYEPALTQLGLFLGADAFKPTGDSRTDSAWCWENTQWISLEAKSAHKLDGVIGVTDTLQVNGYLALVSEDRQVSVLDMSAAVMVSPRALTHKDAITVAADDSLGHSCPRE